jgi:hypothetical protein
MLGRPAAQTLEGPNAQTVKRSGVRRPRCSNVRAAGCSDVETSEDLNLQTLDGSAAQTPSGLGARTAERLAAGVLGRLGCRTLNRSGGWTPGSSEVQLPGRPSRTGITIARRADSVSYEADAGRVLRGRAVERPDGWTSERPGAPALSLRRRRLPAPGQQGRGPSVLLLRQLSAPLLIRLPNCHLSSATRFAIRGVQPAG